MSRKTHFIGGIVLLLMLLTGGVFGKVALDRHAVKVRLARENAAWRTWVFQCRARVSYLSPVRDAEANFAKGDKRLIEFWVGDYALEKQVLGYSGNVDKIATRSFEISLPKRPVGGPMNLAGQAFCGEHRYAKDYNLTMLRLMGLRK